jgi:hypothetical protein
MPPAPPAFKALTATRDQQEALGTGGPGPVPPVDSSAKAPRLVPSHAARLAPAATSIAACPDRAGSVRPETRGHRPRRLLGLLRRATRAGGSYYDPLFERPDLLEDDYYRFRNQPRGW